MQSPAKNGSLYMMKKIELKTERLTLRPIQPGDENQIHEYAGDKEITMMFWLPNDTFEETVEFGGCDCDLGHSEDHSYATLGWIINKKYRKRGFASEAAAALLDFAFTRLNVQKVYAQCDCKNRASFGVMKKIGMKLIDNKGTRTYPKTGITSGEFTCLITKEEWKNESFIF